MFGLVVGSFFCMFSLYFYLRCFRKIPILKSYLWLPLIIIVCYQGYLLDNRPFVSDNVLIITRWIMGFLFVGGVFKLLLDIIALFLMIFKMRPARIINSTPFTLVFFSLIAFIISYGMYHALKNPSLKQVSIYYEDLPKDLENFKIAMIADPHTGIFYRKERLEKAFEKIMAEKPDLIAIVGDAVDAPFAQTVEDTTPFAKLKAKYGVFFIPGNHEYITGYSQWISHFKKFDNIHVLENAHANIDFENTTLSIFGLLDEIATRFGFEPPNADKALKNHNPKHEDFRLLLVHRPYHVENEKIQADLQLSGHTHGGAFFPVNYIIAKSNNGYVRGEYETKSGKVFVGTGMGLWDGLPLRIGTTSEIEIITLKKGNQ